ncbi:hypothetical protein ACW9YQ_17900 (plasmid) [Paraburkholderia strydomiana]
MSARVAFHSEETWSVAFIEELRQTTTWRVTPHMSEVMQADFGNGFELELDFRIHIDGVGLLTSPENRSLLEDIYDFLALQTHPSVRGRGFRGSETLRTHVIQGIHAIDHFLVKGKEIGLDKGGFRAVAGHEMLTLLAERASAQGVVEAVYRWPTELTKYLRRKGSECDDTEIEAARLTDPELFYDTIPENDWTLSLTRDELDRARFWLKNEKLYRRPHGKAGFRFAPSGTELSALVYSNTLWGTKSAFSKPIYPELCYSPIETVHREYLGVPTKTGYEEALCSEKLFLKYRTTLLSFRELSSIGRGVPEACIERLENFRLSEALQLKEEGTTDIPPPDYLLFVEKKAMELFLQHSRHLFSSLLRVLRASKLQNVTPKEVLDTSESSKILLPETTAFGIKCWSLSRQMFKVGLDARKPLERPTARDYFTRLRQNEGLLETIYCLYGAMQLVVGWLLALRVGECLDLHPDCLNAARDWASVETRKSGPGQLRLNDEIPLPALVVRIIRRLRAFHKCLRNIGAFSPQKLFETPKIDGAFSLCIKDYFRCVDNFIDYINAPLTDDGRRLYLRQHQLRKSFALWFYAFAPYETTVTLQWFLRQNDTRQTEVYLRGAFSGNVLRSIQATAATLLVRDGREEADALAKMVLRRFGVTRHNVMNGSGFAAYTRYVERLQQSGELTFETIHFEDAHGARHKVALVVIGDEDDE